MKEGMRRDYLDDICSTLQPKWIVRGENEKRTTVKDCSERRKRDDCLGWEVKDALVCFGAVIVRGY